MIEGAMRPRERASRSARTQTSRCAVLAALLALPLSTSCYDGLFLEGKSCAEDSNCGPNLRCEAGICGGPPQVTSDSTTFAATATATTASATTDLTTGGSSTSSTSTDTSSSTSATTDGVSGTTTSATTGPACECDSIDVLIIIDQSMSMEVFEDKVIAVFFEFFNGLEDAISNYCSYHIGFTFASEVGHNDMGCQQLGSLITKANDDDCAAMHTDGRPYVNETDELGPALLCIAGAGSTNIEGEQNPRPARALLNAISPELNAPGACNDGFFRPEAPLAILLITDIDDDQDGHPDGYGSPNDPNDWFPELFEANYFDPYSLSIAMLIGPEVAQNGCDAGPAPRLHEFAGLFLDDNTAVANICDDAETLTQEFVGSLEILFSVAGCR